MKNQKIQSLTEDFVKKELKQAEAGHDWLHTERVRNLSRKLSEREGGDLFVIEMSALLHDVSDWKFHDENQKILEIKNFLKNIGVEPEYIEKIIHVIESISFKGAGVENKIKSIEGKIVQDADRLDALGAIGIARAFAYGGHKNHIIYDPNIKPVIHKTAEEYEKKQSTTINHFYEKLFLLKDKMNTKTGRQMAEERHVFMETFVSQFLKEWQEASSQ